jgi:hypothetical protein
MSKQRTFITFEIDPEIREAFGDRLKLEGKTITGVLKQFINEYLHSEGESKDSDSEILEMSKRLAVVEGDLAVVKEKLGGENIQLLGELAA